MRVTISDARVERDRPLHEVFKRGSRLNCRFARMGWLRVPYLDYYIFGVLSFSHGGDMVQFSALSGSDAGDVWGSPNLESRWIDAEEVTITAR